MSQGKRLTLQDYQQTALGKGLEFIGDLPKNTNHLGLWRCLECGYVWETRYATIYRGRGCVRCNGYAKHTIEDFEKEGLHRGLIWLGPKIVEARATTWWECVAHGHRFQSSNHNFWRWIALQNVHSVRIQHLSMENEHRFCREKLGSNWKV